LKYWRGYLTAFIFSVITWGLVQLGQNFSELVDMVYPYVIRTAQNMLANWSGGVDFVVWQMLLMAALVVGLALVVLMIILKWNPFQCFGWVLAAASCVYMLHTLVFGLNYFAGPIHEDIRLEMVSYNVEELTEAAEYYRDQANALAKEVNRDGNGNVDFADFDTLAQQTGSGFHSLVYDHSYPIFAGETLPVKELAWADLFTKYGVTGITVGLTGESAVNPMIPDICLPFSMSHEMAHRMCIAGEENANFAAFMAGTANESIEYQYSAWFMAYRYCYYALLNANTAETSAAAARVSAGVSDELSADLIHYNNFFAANGTVSGAPSGSDTSLFGEVTDMLVCWHIQHIVLPSLTVEELPFDPYDTTQVDLSGNVNARPEETVPPTTEGAVG